MSDGRPLFTMVKEKRALSTHEDLGAVILKDAPKGAIVSSSSELSRIGVTLRLRVSHLNEFKFPEGEEGGSLAGCASDLIDEYKRKRDRGFSSLSRADEAHRRLTRRLRACVGSEEANLLVIPGITRASSEKTKLDPNAAGYIAFIDTPGNTWTVVIGVDSRSASEIKMIASSSSISVQKVIKSQGWSSLHDESARF